MTQDIYFASGSFKDATHLYLNLNFEILNGCKFQCQGCHVEKNAQQPIEDFSIQKLDKLFDSFASEKYKLNFLFIGPTDFLSATNTATILGNSKIVNLFKKFKRISFQTTYLNISNAQEIADLLNKNFSDIELEIDILLEAGKIHDDRYLKRIEENKFQFTSMLHHKNIRTFALMNVYDYDMTSIPLMLKDYEQIHQKVKHLFEYTIDYNFSFMRSKDITREEFLKLSTRVKNLYNSSLDSRSIQQSLRFSFGKLKDTLLEKHLNFRNDKLYYSPLLYERFVTFHPSFEIPFVEFSASEYESFERELCLGQYANVSTKDECEHCPLLSACVERGVLSILDHFEISTCPVSKESYFKSSLVHSA